MSDEDRSRFEQSSRLEPSRRAVLGGIAAGLTVGIVPPGFAQGKGFVSTVLGGVFEREYRKGVVEPFMKQTGIKVNLKLGNPSEWVTSAMINRRRPEIDLLFLPFPDNIRAVIQGIGIPLTEQDIPNLKNVLPECRDQFQGKAVGMDYLANGIAYRTDMISNPPKSWKDLWNPEYAGKIAIPDIVGLGVWEILVIAARLNGGDETNLDPAFKALQALKPNIRKFYKSTVELAQLLDSGEAAIAAIAPSNRIYDLMDAGKPVKFVVPTEGATLGMVSFHIAQNSPNTELCKQFIDFALSPRPQEDFCNGMTARPSTRHANVAQRVQERVPPIDQMFHFDWFKIVPQMDALTDRWNRELGR
jgi:putative spermidine/putrescine transport system substrate-binding protein